MATKKKSSKKSVAKRKSATKKSATKRKSATKKSATKRKSATKKSSSRKYGATAQKKVGRSMHEMKRGKLKSGRSGKKVKSKKQAIAIGLSEARKRGAKVPKKR
jgi:hypothetical protein